METITEFRNEVIREIKNYLPDKYADIDIVEQDKTEINGNVLHGICLRMGKLNPILYLDKISERYEFVCPAALSEIADTIIEATSIPPLFDAELDNIHDFSYAQDKLELRMVNGSNARTFDKAGIMYRQVMDLLLYPVIILAGAASFKVTRGQADAWGADEDTIFNQAGNNSREKIRIRSVRDMLMDLNPMAEVEDAPMIIATSESGIGGAVAMLFPDVREAVADKLGTDDLAIIPSSINEVIFIPNSPESFVLGAWIREINATEVDPEEVLSDHPYFSSNGSLSMPDIYKMRKECLKEIAS